VLLLGIVVAVSQVRKRLGGMEGVWFVPRTWFLFVAYAAVPVVLFWLLDRTGAINDTSLFAAVLIGVGYERIITGGNETLRAPGDVSSLWTPFVAYADKVSKIVLERGARNQRRLAEKIISEIMEDEERYKALEALALARSTDVVAVRAALQEIDKVPETGHADKVEKKTRYLYGLLLSLPDVHYLLNSKDIISDRFYRAEITRMYHTIAAACVALAVIAAAAVSAWYLDFREIAASYHVWRLGKTNSTKVDQFRSRHALVTVMMQEPALRQAAADKLIYLTQRPGLPMERVDLVVETLLESRVPRTPRHDLPARLVNALRGESLDARSRVKEALVFLTAACATEVDAALRDWKPTERDSSTALETKIRDWNTYWTVTCPPA
jgi:hypothetical protein